MSAERKQKIRFINVLASLRNELYFERLEQLEAARNPDIPDARRKEHLEWAQALEGWSKRIKVEMDELRTGFLRQWLDGADVMVQEMARATAKVDEVHKDMEQTVEDAQVFVRLVGKLDDVIGIVRPFL